MVVTRCFGTLPYLMIVPFADCANHNAVDNHFSICNVRLQAKLDSLEGDEKHYVTTERKKINYLKHFAEEPFDDKLQISYKTTQYAKKLAMRN